MKYPKVALTHLFMMVVADQFPAIGRPAGGVPYQSEEAHLTIDRIHGGGYLTEIGHDEAGIARGRPNLGHSGYWHTVRVQPCS